MFPNVYFIFMDYRLQLHKKHGIYPSIYQKFLLKQQMQESKLALPKTMTRELFWLL